MKSLNLSIYTGIDEGDHKITMTASFATHEEAVRFHEGVARLCRDASHQTKNIAERLLIPKFGGR